MKTVGFVGLGIMGKAMVKNLCKAGISPLIYDIRRLQKRTLPLQKNSLLSEQCQKMRRKSVPRVIFCS